MDEYLQERNWIICLRVFWEKGLQFLWDKLESPWYDANSQYETESAATLCLFETMNETR